MLFLQTKVMLIKFASDHTLAESEYKNGETTR